MSKIFVFFAFLTLLLKCEPARILGVFPVPVISHQLVFRKLTNELVKRGHHVTVITGLPTNEPHLENYTEIDRREVAYDVREKLLAKEMDTSYNMFTQYSNVLEITFSIVDGVINCPEVADWIKNKNEHFDLIFVEDCVRSGSVLSHLFKAPVISISSFGGTFETFDIVGGATHTFLYPIATKRKYRDLTIWEKMFELYVDFRLQRMYKYWEDLQDETNKKRYGPDTPTIHELNNNIKMLFLNIHSVWDSNRPVPPNVVYLGGLHQNPEKELPKDLKSLLDSSTNGAIYMSLGTIVNENLFPKEKIQIFINVFSKLPYDVYWKWDGHELVGLPKNIKIFKWFPQSDFLRHTNIKVFITQGGLQSTDEAITAGVPLIGIPIIFDQYLNTDKYVQLKIGMELDITTLTEEIFRNTITEVINDKTYKDNVIKLREKINDVPQTSLERAVFWTEHLLKHGAEHLRAPSANMSWYIYYEMDVILTAMIVFIVIIIFIVKFVIVLYNLFIRKVKVD